MPYDFGALLPQTAAKVKFRDEPIRSLEGKKLGRIEDRKVAAGSSVACKLWFVEKGTSTLQRNGRPRDSRAEPNVSPHCRAHCRLWRTRAEPATSCARHPPVESTPAAHIPPFTLQLPAGLPAYSLPLLNSTPQLHRLPLAVLFQLPFSIPLKATPPPTALVVIHVRYMSSWPCHPSPRKTLKKGVSISMCKIIGNCT